MWKWEKKNTLKKLFAMRYVAKLYSLYVGYTGYGYDLLDTDASSGKNCKQFLFLEVCQKNDFEQQLTQYKHILIFVEDSLRYFWFKTNAFGILSLIMNFIGTTIWRR